MGSLYRFYSTGAIVVVQLALQGALSLPMRVIPLAGNPMDAPCGDDLELATARSSGSTATRRERQSPAGSDRSTISMLFFSADAFYFQAAVGFIR